MTTSSSSAVLRSDSTKLPTYLPTYLLIRPHGVVGRVLPDLLLRVQLLKLQWMAIGRELEVDHGSVALTHDFVTVLVDGLGYHSGCRQVGRVRRVRREVCRSGRQVRARRVCMYGLPAYIHTREIVCVQSEVVYLLSSGLMTVLKQREEALITPILPDVCGQVCMSYHTYMIGDGTYTYICKWD